MSKFGRYAFSDSELAEQRLKLVADAFSESTRCFLHDAIDGPTDLAIDLGCGPGHTTHLLADTTACERAIGLDKSQAFVSTALRSANDRVSFLAHNVTEIPFPTDPADIIYCRLLLTHLEDPISLLIRWATQLTPNGHLLLEEVEGIRTENEVLVAYIDIVEALLANRGNDLYIGRKLAGLGDINGLTPGLNRTFAIKVPEYQAAAMFSLNIKVWKGSEFIKATYQDTLIAGLGEQLTLMASDRDAEQSVEWLMRQLALQHDP